jgi:tripartite-type tricarboxylate transporter receptor subunit TctC
MNPTRTALAVATAIACLAAYVTTAVAQQYPSKPIRIMVAAAPGVPTDTLARGLVEPLGRSFGQSIIVENRVGADGIIGTEACAKTPADGYALCGTASNVMIWNTLLRRNLPYDTLRDFAPVIQVAFADSALIVHPSVPARNVTELIDLTKKNPGKINWAHFGINSTGYMYEEWFKRRKQAPFYAVPYKTQPQVMQAILTNESNVAVYGLATIQSQLKSGQLRPLAVTANKRIEWLPNVPTFEEEGIKLPLRTWFGYHYQAAVPRPIIARLNGEIRKAVESTTFRTQIIDRAGLSLAAGTSEDFDAYVRQQITEVRELVNYIGLKPE